MAKQWTPYLSIKTKLFLLVLTAIIASISLASWQSIRVTRQGSLNTDGEHLKSNRESKSRQLESYFKQIRDQVQTLSADFMRPKRNSSPNLIRPALVLEKWIETTSI